MKKIVEYYRKVYFQLYYFGHYRSKVVYSRAKFINKDDRDNNVALYFMFVGALLFIFFYSFICFLHLLYVINIDGQSPISPSPFEAIIVGVFSYTVHYKLLFTKSSHFKILYNHLHQGTKGAILPFFVLVIVLIAPFFLLVTWRLLFFR